MKGLFQVDSFCLAFLLVKLPQPQLEMACSSPDPKLHLVSHTLVFVDRGDSHPHNLGEFFGRYRRVVVHFHVHGQGAVAKLHEGCKRA
jgi:hypothetical protein